MSLAFWSDACFNALNTPLHTRLNILYTTCGLTVAIFCLCAAASAYMHVRWQRLHKNKSFVWRLYGWFTALSCAGSVFGCASSLSKMQNLSLFYRATDALIEPSTPLTQSQIWSLVSLSYRWQAAFDALSSFDFMFLSISKLLVLDRMFELVEWGGTAGWDGRHQRLARGGALVLGVVVVGTVVGFGGGFAAAAYFVQVADLIANAAASYAAGDAAAAAVFISASSSAGHTAFIYKSIQGFAQVTVLLLIIVAFIVAGIVFTRFANSKLSELQLALAGDADAACRVDEFSAMRSTGDMKRLAGAASERGKKLRLQVLSTVSVVFVTFLLRAVFAVMFSVSGALQHDGNGCMGFCDVPCHDVHTLVQSWIAFTPEFQFTVTLISSPLALLIALWGVTTQRALQLMSSSAREMSPKNAG